MDRDLGEFIALIAVASGAVILGLSYMAAYLIGRSNGRRDEQRSPLAMEQAEMAQRLASMEATVRSLNSSVERLMDAQRLLVAQQDHLSRKVGLADRNPAALRAVPASHTPS